jgi:hypothetical protein
MLPSSDRTAHLLRISTTIIFLLLGLGAYLFAAVVGSGAPAVVLQSIGGFLIGTVVVSYAYEYFLHEETENRTITKLDDLLGRRVDGIFPGAAQYGFNGFATEAPRNSFDTLEAGDELLWLDTYSPDLMLFVPKLQSALERGAMVRMLMIDPAAETTRMRAEEIAEAGYNPSHFSEGAANFFDVVVNAAKEISAPRGKLEIRRFSDLPCVPCTFACATVTRSVALPATSSRKPRSMRPTSAGRRLPAECSRVFIATSSASGVATPLRSTPAVPIAPTPELQGRTFRRSHRQLLCLAFV